MAPHWQLRNFVGIVALRSCPPRAKGLGSGFRDRWRFGRVFPWASLGERRIKMWIGWCSSLSFKKMVGCFFLQWEKTRRAIQYIVNVRTVYVDVDLFLVLEVVLQEETIPFMFLQSAGVTHQWWSCNYSNFAAAANTSLGLWTHHAGLCQPCPFQHNCAHFRWLLSASPRRFVCTNSPEQKLLLCPTGWGKAMLFQR